MNTFKYCKSLTRYKRMTTQQVEVGETIIGSQHPVRIQSMTNTDTSDTEATVEQIKKIANAGADLVRMTTRTVAEAKNIANIRKILRTEGYSIPLVADVHFNPKIAETAAQIVDKVRINPGNYALKKTHINNFDHIRENFINLIRICKTNQTAIRIGVNHGSLSQRILDKYGNTPEGMVQSTLEFLNICEEEKFDQVIVSLKSSNTRVMVQANRLLMHYMINNGKVYPLHLGVTEAGEGEDGRIRSAVGIGALLADGLGDTIRVSLTESPEREIPVAKKLVDFRKEKQNHESLKRIYDNQINPFQYQKRKTIATHLNSFHPNPVIAPIDGKAILPDNKTFEVLKPEFIMDLIPGRKTGFRQVLPKIVNYNKWRKSDDGKTFPFFHSISGFLKVKAKSSLLNFIFASMDDLDELDSIRGDSTVILIVQNLTTNRAAEQRLFIYELIKKNINVPVISHGSYQENNKEDLQLKASADQGLLFLDGLADGILIENKGNISLSDILSTSFGILQASRIRPYKTEFISCPGCGRTQFDLEKTTREIRKELGHLKGLKIAVMGCIVNGPGEMADADYGYVGSGAGKVTLYKGKKIVKKNVSEDKALDELKNLIKQNRDWKVWW